MHVSENQMRKPEFISVENATDVLIQVGQWHCEWRRLGAEESFVRLGG